MIDEPTSKQVQTICGIEKWRKEPATGICARFWAWTLKIWNKCVFLPPNSLVSATHEFMRRKIVLFHVRTYSYGFFFLQILENCDYLFEHNAFSSVDNHSLLYVFKPDLDTFKKILRKWNELGLGKDFYSICSKTVSTELT